MLLELYALCNIGYYGFSIGLTAGYNLCKTRVIAQLNTLTTPPLEGRAK